MAYHNFFTRFYKHQASYFRPEVPEPEWGTKVYPKHPPAAPTQYLASVGKLKYAKPTPDEITEAVQILTWAIGDICEAWGLIDERWGLIDERWGLIGGAAVTTYATYYKLPRRQTTDINVVIQPDLGNQLTAEEVSEELCSTFYSRYFEVRRVSGVDIPQVKVSRGEGRQVVLIDVEILDHYVWQERRKDYDLSIPRNMPFYVPINGMDVCVLNAHWMLRQTILMWNEREELQKMNDKADIETFCDVLHAQNTRQLEIKGEKDIKKLKAFLKDFDNDPMVLGSVVHCPEVFGPWYDLKWVRRTFAMFLFFAAPVAFDWYTST